MYLVSVVVFAIVAPVVSILIEYFTSPGADLLAVVGKWYVFWGVGIRLFSAGLSQMKNPGFTAKNILGKTDDGANFVVQELGFANTAVGGVAIAAAWIPGWTVPLALVGGVFLGLAGLRHIVKRNKNTKELFATVTDLIIAAVLLFFAIATLVG